MGRKIRKKEWNEWRININVPHDKLVPITNWLYCIYVIRRKLFSSVIHIDDERKKKRGASPSLPPTKKKDGDMFRVCLSKLRTWPLRSFLSEDSFRHSPQRYEPYHATSRAMAPLRESKANNLRVLLYYDSSFLHRVRNGKVLWIDRLISIRWKNGYQIRYRIQSRIDYLIRLETGTQLYWRIIKRRSKFREDEVEMKRERTSVFWDRVQD